MGKLLHSKRSLIFLLMFIIFSEIWIFNSCGLTNLDYHLSKSKYAEASISDQMGFHGPNSADLSVVNKGHLLQGLDLPGRSHAFGGAWSTEYVG